MQLVYGPKTKAQAKRERRAASRLQLVVAGGRAKGSARASKRSRRRNMASVVRVPFAGYLRLLADPCGAEMAPTPYLGGGSDLMVRTRQIMPIGNNVDWVYQFSPQYGSNMHIYSASGTTAGGALGTYGVLANPPSFLTGTSVGAYRCAAACVRVMYSGTEAARSGMIYSQNVTAGQIRAGATPPSGATSTTFAQGANRMVRLGEELHEARWLPTESDSDWIWSNVDGAGANTQPTGGAFIIGGLGTPANTISLDLTAVWEWTPEADTNNGLAYQPRMPTTYTLNDVLASFKRYGVSAAEFATSPTGATRLSNLFATAGALYKGTAAYNGIYSSQMSARNSFRAVEL